MEGLVCNKKGYSTRIAVIPDTSRRRPPTPQDFGCISFVWGSSREISQKVDVVWFPKLQSLWWSSQLGDCNAHLEATAVLLGLQDLGGKLITGSHIGVILGPSLAILWVMLKLSRAMVGHAEAICQMLLGHVVGFVPQNAFSQKHQDFKWVLASYVGCIWGSNARIEATLGWNWGQVWPSWALLRYLEASFVSCGKVGGSWGQAGHSGGHVEAKLGYALSCWSYMSGFARPCCWFCIQECIPPQQDQDFKCSKKFIPMAGTAKRTMFLLRKCRAWRQVPQ